MASKCSVCSTPEHTSECVNSCTVRVKTVEERRPRCPEFTGERRSGADRDASCDGRQPSQRARVDAGRDDIGGERWKCDGD